jgi:hypothetical protein
MDMRGRLYGLTSRLPIRVKLPVERWLLFRQCRRDVRKLSGDDWRERHALRDYELNLLWCEWNAFHSDRLLKQANALHLEHPPRKVGGKESEYWELDMLDLPTLTRSGCAWMRRRIREERKAVWEDRTRPWTGWITMIGAVVAAVTGLITMWNSYATWKQHQLNPPSNQVQPSGASLSSKP